MRLPGKIYDIKSLCDFIYQCQHLGISQWEIHSAALAQQLHQRQSQRQQVD